MKTQTHKWLPEQPTQEMINNAVEAFYDMQEVGIGNLNDDIEAALKAAWEVAPEVEQEPVAWMNKDGYIALYKQGDVVIPLYTRQQSIRNLALIWAQGYRAGISDERESEANIGIAGGDYKVEPNRKNPYENIYPQPNQSEQSLDMVKREPLSEDEILNVLDKNQNSSDWIKFARAIEKAHGIEESSQ